MFVAGRYFVFLVKLQYCSFSCSFIFLNFISDLYIKKFRFILLASIFATDSVSLTYLSLQLLVKFLQPLLHKSGIKLQMFASTFYTHTGSSVLQCHHLDNLFCLRHLKCCLFIRLVHSKFL